MKTVVIKMHDLAPDENGAMVYPVQLFFDDGDPDWLRKPVGKPSSIPEDLSLPKPMLDHMKKPIDGAKIRDLFLDKDYLPGHVRDCGEYLYQLLFQGSIAEEWQRLHGLYAKKDAQKAEGLRTILDIKPDALRWLPWELMRQNTLTWFIDPGNPFSRGTFDESLKPKSSMWPIHILVLVGSKADDEQVSAELELQKMEAAFIKSPVPVDWKVCLRPKKDALKPLIEQYKPQIIHFIGHGKQVNYSYLELSDATEEAGPQEWTADDVAIDLQNWKPRLVFINACRSSNAGAQENSWDIAHTFANQGVPAVVGMQADIQGAAAAGFSQMFYESILTGRTIDCALAEARSAVRNLPGFSLRSRDWALATIYLQQLPEQIFNMTPQIDQQTQAKFKADELIHGVHDFVGRFTQRRELWHGVDEVEDFEEQFKRACIVVGNKGMGKTSLLQASMKVCALRGRRICYVNLRDTTTKEFVDILGIIRSGDESREILCKPLPTEPFKDFDDKYGPLLAQPNAVEIFAGDNNRCDQLFDAYKAALVSIAATKPLILVLDHLNVVWATFNPVMVKRLLLPIAQGELANCRLLLACSVDDFEQHLLKDLIKAAHVVSIDKWHVDRFVPLMRQICLYNNIDLNAAVEGIIKFQKDLVKSEFEPTKLRQVVNSLR